MSRLATAVAISLALAAPAARAANCALQPPRLFPAYGEAVPPNVRLVVFAREENKRDFQALDRARPQLTNGRRTVALNRDPALRRSPRGERVLVYVPAKPLDAGTWRLAGLPKLSPFFQALATAQWRVEGEADRAAPATPGADVARARCAAIGTDRVCVVALEGRNGAEPVLLEALLTPAKGAPVVYADVVAPGAEPLLRNDACDSPFAKLEGGRYGAQLRVVDVAGNASLARVKQVDVTDVNESLRTNPAAGDGHVEHEH